RTDSLSLDYLLRLIDQKEVYMEVREGHILQLEEELKKSHRSDSLAYTLQKLLYQDYTTYKPDSAITYVHKNLKLALEKENSNWIDESRLDLASLYLTIGMYIDSYQLLSTLSARELDQTLLVKYYDTWKNFYKFYSFNNPNEDFYIQKSDVYRDSLLSELDPSGNHYQIVYAEKLYDAGKLREAKRTLQAMLDGTIGDTHERAVLSYAMAYVYQKEGNVQQQRYYLIQSASCDIKNAIKENAAMQALASLLYDAGEIEPAYKCIKSSMEDAIFCNARFRTYEISKVFPIIDSAYQENEVERRFVLTSFLIVVSVLSLFLVVAVIYVYLQMRRIARVRQQLFEANQALNKLNL